MTTKTVLISAKAPVEVNDAGAEIPLNHMGRVNSFGQACAILLKNCSIKSAGISLLGDKILEVGYFGMATNHLEPLHEANVPDLARVIADAFNDTLNRVATACRDNITVQLSSTDMCNLGLNKAGFELLGDEGFLTLFPGQSWEKQLIVRDPAKLRVVKDDQPEDRLINGVLVMGVRVIGMFQHDMFPDLDCETEVLISLEGKTPEIAHRMKISDAQQLFQGYTLLSARVICRHGKTPEVQGNLSLQRT